MAGAVDNYKSCLVRPVADYAFSTLTPSSGSLEVDVDARLKPKDYTALSRRVHWILRIHNWFVIMTCRMYCVVLICDYPSIAAHRWSHTVCFIWYLINATEISVK